MSLSRDDVRKISLLARLELTPAELESMTTQLGAIVGYVESLRELDVTNVEPMAHALDVSNVFAEDAVRPSLERATALANAPHSNGECYLVPAVLGD
jgi:aspartyl-tRNA(Asn)/glutamyl-tRNA(Gln) amidotransferase subunit C